MPGPTVAPSQPLPSTAGESDIPESSPQTDPGVIHLQLLPHNEQPGRPALGDVVERKFKDGMSVRIGRQVIRDGQPTVLKGSKPPSDNDIWYASKVVSRNHAEMWAKDGQIYIKDIGSSSGTFLNKMRLSPSGKESRPYPLKEGDILQFGIDYKGKPDDIYKSVTVRVGFYDQSWVQQQRRKANPARFRTALKMLLAAANPYASASNEEVGDESAQTDCCICIGAIGPFQALFVAPCSHCYHYKCVHSLLAQSAMFQCPMCRQVANLAASVSMDSLFDEEEASSGTSTTGDAISRKLGQLRDGGENPDATLAAAPAAPQIQRLQLTNNTASGDVTPKNDRSGTPVQMSPDSDAASGRSTPTPLAESSGGRRPRTLSGGAEPSSASGTTTPERGVAAPTARNHKRRSSITSKINALLRRGGGRSDHDSSDHAPPAPVREESMGQRQDSPDAEDEYEPLSPVSPTTRSSDEGMKRNVTAHSVADSAGLGEDRSEATNDEEVQEGRISDVSVGDME